MRVEVVCYPKMWEGGRSDANALFTGIKVPDGFSITGEAKFVVLRKGDNFVIAIGALIGARGYAHKHLNSCAERDFPGLEASGGGDVTFTGRNFFESTHWAAEFGGYSQGLGVFDPEILHPEIRKAIRISLGLQQVGFTWKGSG